MFWSVLVGILQVAFAHASSQAVSFIELRSSKSSPGDTNEIIEVKRRPELTGPSLINVENKERKASEEKRSMSTFAGPCVVSTALEEKLDEVAAASHKLRLRLAMCTCGLGFIPLLATQFMQISLSYFVLNPYDVGHVGYHSSITAWSAPIVLLCLMPNDAFLIRSAILGCFVAALSCSGAYFGAALYAYFGQPEMPKKRPEDPTVYMCGDDEPFFGCLLYISKCTCIAAILFWWCVYSTFLLKRHNGFFDFSFYDRTKGPGHRYHDCAFQLQSRVALNKGWTSIRLASLSFSIIWAIHSMLFHWAGELAPFYTRDDNRRTIIAFLMAINIQGEAQAAATLAALLGDGKASDSLHLARERFRCISFSQLEEEDFLKNEEDENKKNRLFGLTKRSKLGKCDAFLSHSWHDDGKKKFRALRKWAKEFKETNHRDPVIWLDKACIDQTNIADDLLCLPIFTAGCQTLLIVAGPTYTERLWCIIEIFVFRKMGGEVDRITVVPIDMTHQVAKESFDTVDARNSKCFLEADRQKLLGIIEQGFGDFDDFNILLHHVFKKRTVEMQGSSLHRIWSRQGTRKNRIWSRSATKKNIQVKPAN